MYFKHRPYLTLCLSLPTLFMYYVVKLYCLLVAQFRIAVDDLYAYTPYRIRPLSTCAHKQTQNGLCVCVHVCTFIHKNNKANFQQQNKKNHQPTHKQSKRQREREQASCTFTLIHTQTHSGLHIYILNITFYPSRLSLEFQWMRVDKRSVINMVCAYIIEIAAALPQPNDSEKNVFTHTNGRELAQLSVQIHTRAIGSSRIISC